MCVHAAHWVDALDEMNHVLKPSFLLFQLSFCRCMTCTFTRGKKKQSVLRISLA